MATNPYVNKVEYGGTTLMDITDTTADDADVAEGKVYYKASGLRSVGTASGGGGGASNVVSGTFTTGSEAAIEVINVPYTGNGYPIILALIAEDGVRGSNILSSARPLVGYCAWKNYMDTEPEYAATGGYPDNAGVCVLYKSNASAATSTNYRASASQNIYAQTVSTSYGGVAISASDQFKVQVSASTSYCLHPSTVYRYVIVYNELP